MNSESPIYHAKHVFRAAIMLVALVTALLLGRSCFVPDSWGEYGWYRGDAVADHAAKPVRHLGDEACAMCHDDIYGEHAAGVHAAVRCELCHGPVAGHADLEEGEKIAEMTIRRTRELCELCHRALVARPTDFPQVDVREHVTEMDAELTGDVCFQCHDPHSPF